MVQVKVEGLRELEAQLAKLTKATGKRVLKKTLVKAAHPLAELAASKVPVGEGDLKRSITVGVKLANRQAKLHRKAFRDDRRSVEVFIGASYELGAGGRHAHLVEFGTVHSAPHPFMRPAWDNDQKALLDRLSKDLWREVSAAVGRAERRAAKAAAKSAGAR